MATRAATKNGAATTKADDRADAERRVRLGILDERVRDEVAEDVKARGTAAVARDYNLTRAALTSFLAGTGHKSTNAFVQMQHLHRTKESAR